MAPNCLEQLLPTGYDTFYAPLPILARETIPTPWIIFCVKVAYTVEKVGEHCSQCAYLGGGTAEPAEVSAPALYAQVWVQCYADPLTDQHDAEAALH